MVINILFLAKYKY